MTAVRRFARGGTPAALAAALTVWLAAGSAFANTLCEAKNEHGDICKASCPAGQQASCRNGKSDDPPSCRCLADESSEQDSDDPEEPVVLLAAARGTHEISDLNLRHRSVAARWP